MPTPSLHAPTLSELTAIYQSRHPTPGWGPRMRMAQGYFTPDDYYEALVAQLVTTGCDWADVGCGRDIFPSHAKLAGVLSKRAGYVLGIDPDPNIQENPFLSEKYQGLVDDYQGARQFDVITMRMVAEHITNPAQAMRNVAGMLKVGGIVIIFTPFRWSPMALVATLIPFWLHNPLKRLIWHTESRDTFPTAFRLNTRAALAQYASGAHLSEQLFCLLDDCRVTGEYRTLHRIDLNVRRALNAVGLHHPELCILAAYRREA
jgi:SAM-dependent methyltransferase